MSALSAMRGETELRRAREAEEGVPLERSENVADSGLRYISEAARRERELLQGGTQV